MLGNAHRGGEVSDSYKIRILCCIWAACAIIGAFEKGLIALIAVIGAIYITHHMLGFKM